MGKITQKGFTLIELLVAMALLSALAVAALLALDPLEQFRKGNDTNYRNTISEIYSALNRYYAINNQFTWGTAAVTTQALTGGAAQTAISAAIDAGELKPDFTSVAGTSRLANIYLTVPTGGRDFYLCFKPAAKASQKDSATIWGSDGSAGANCKATGGTADCYWCLK